MDEKIAASKGSKEVKAGSRTIRNRLPFFYRVGGAREAVTWVTIMELDLSGRRLRV